MRSARMNKILGMTSRQRGKVLIIVSGVFLMILIFVVPQILSKFNILWVSFDNINVEDRSEFDRVTEIAESVNLLQMLDKSDKLMPFTGEKLVHLDLKGAAPLVSFYAKLFPFLRRLGATGLLIEYEDMFPYKDELEELKAHNAYTSSDVREILRLAEENQLSVIPLVQTMGHLEFVLKLEKFRELREIENYPNSLCPSHEKVPFLIEKMIDQVLEAHPKSKYIHIGCDEVFFLGKCIRCRKVMSDNFWSPQHLFLNHVKRTAVYINKTYSGVRPIIWSDMLDHIKGDVIESSEIAHLVDIMAWNYWSKVSDYMNVQVLEKFEKYFKSIWIASAFKGATTSSSIVPNTGYHLANHFSWMAIVTWWKKSINFKGIAITGWQRYDHFAVLCELLPVGLPSLVLDMLYLQDPTAEDYKARLTKFLRCQWVLGFEPPDFQYYDSDNCDFPGFKVFRLVNKFANFTEKLKSSPVANIKNGWFSMYNVAHKFTSPYYIEKIFRWWPLDKYRKELVALEEELRAALSEVYDEHTVDEWIMTHVTPEKMRLDVFLNARDSVRGQNVWPRRPFTSESSLRNASDICGVDETFGCTLLMT